MTVRAKLNVAESGVADGQPMVFAHGFGCDQHMWRLVAPAFEGRFRVIVFDYVGAGGSDLSAYDPQRYASLDGYAADVIELCDELGLQSVVFVGHSVSSMVGAVAAGIRPDLFEKLIFVGPSARYIDDGEYVGGFSSADIDELLDSMDSNFLGWSSSMAPAIMGNPDRPALGAELEASFCRTDPAVARQFAEVTFRSDNRADLTRVAAPVLILQCREDAIAPLSAGEYVRDHVADGTFVVLDATGHCPHLSAPAATISAVSDFVRPQ